MSRAVVRDATPTDAEACAAIYAPYVRETATSFDGMGRGSTAYDELTEEIHERTEARTWQRA